MNLSLNPEEATVLKDVLTNHLSELSMQISNTERFELRESLKRRQSIIRSVIDRLERQSA